MFVRRNQTKRRSHRRSSRKALGMTYNKSCFAGKRFSRRGHKSHSNVSQNRFRLNQSNEGRPEARPWPTRPAAVEFSTDERRHHRWMSRLSTRKRVVEAIVDKAVEEYPSVFPWRGASVCAVGGERRNQTKQGHCL